jgi:uncharacterized protein YbjT (DUF2867 family)
VTPGKLVLVTGATGYIGGCLVPRLLEKGYRVRALVRDPGRLSGRSWFSQIGVAHGDIILPDLLHQAMQGVFTAYYLIHNMTSGPGYFEKEVDSARKFASAARAAGVQHIIYLGGLADPQDDIGLHLRSRIQTGVALRNEGVPLTEFRASLIIGAGSISFEMIRYLTEQLPILFGPAWINNLTQPIAVQNVLDYLLAALENSDSHGKIYEIGGRDILTYAGTISVYARLRGLKRRVIALPGLSVDLMARFAGLLTPIPTRIAGPLLGGMCSDSVVRDESAKRDFPQIHSLDYETSVSMALEHLSPGCLETGWENGASSFKIKRAGFFIEGQRIRLAIQPAAAFRVITSLGGRAGWLYLNALWKLRGFVDRLVGGPGLRGRKTGHDLVVGDVLDFYRVEALENDRLMRLKAELKAPGQGWMEWRVEPDSEAGVLITQIAYFAPKGLSGFLYWYVLLPVHRLVFTGLIKAIARHAQNVVTTKSFH